MSLTPTQKAFATSREAFPAFVGGFGCMRADTPVATPSGFVGIADLRAGDDVLSWDEIGRQFQHAPTSGAFPKGKANLLRVITTRGEFVASEHHLVLVPDGRYRPLASLGAGDLLGTASAGLRGTSAGFGRIWSPEDDLHYWQKLSNYLDDCGDEAHQHDPRLRRAVNSALVFSQEQVGAHRCGQCFSLAVSGRKDGPLERIQTRNHPDQCACLLRRNCFYGRLDLIGGGAGGPSLKEFSGHTSQLIQRIRRFHGNCASHLQAALSSLWLQVIQWSDSEVSLSHGRVEGDSFPGLALAHMIGFSQPNRQFVGLDERRQRDSRFEIEAQGLGLAYGSTIETPIIRIERKSRKEWYWDMHVAGNNNYLTKDGSIHHNSGKTAAGIARAMALKSHFRSCDVAYYLPTYPLVEDIAFRRFPELCDRKEWDYKLNKASAYIEFPGAGRIVFRTMERPERIVGYEVAHSVLDELDTLPTEKAREVWNKVIARNRQKCAIPNTAAVATTPEGFRFVWERWVKNSAPGYALFRAKTSDNAANLPKGYIDSLKGTYSSALLSAYLDGEFVNLQSGSVYPDFDRNLNHSRETIQSNEPLHVGMDFNVTKGAAVVFVLRDGKPHAVTEYTDVFDTPEMIHLLKSRHVGHSIFVYPDASGGSRKSNNASVTDLALLKQAGFRVCANPSNPAVKDRILALNSVIRNRELLVNPDGCPAFVEALEKQSYTKHGEPDKSTGLDHIVDGGGYFIAYKFPIVKRTATISSLRM